MKIIRFLLKMALFPIMLIVTVVQWFGVFIIGFSSMVFNVLAGLFLLVAVLSYLMGVSAGAEAVKMIVAGFIVFMIPVAGDWTVTAITALNMGMRKFIRS